MASWLRRSNNEPFFWLAEYPIYVTELLIILHSLAFVVLAIGSRVGYAPWIVEHLQFLSSDVLLKGRVWELVTYVFVPQISLFFVLNMLMLLWFGRPLEEHLGRKGFLLLYLCLTACPMLILSALEPVMHGSQFIDSQIVHFSLFLAFAALFPEAEIFGRFQAKWVSLILLAVYSLIAIACYGNYITYLVVLWISSAIASFAIRAPFFSGFVEWLENHREMQEAATIRKRKLRVEQERQVQEQVIDEILDKIAQHGMQSLTREERSILERVRVNLLKKEKR